MAYTRLPSTHDFALAFQRHIQNLLRTMPSQNNRDDYKDIQILCCLVVPFPRWLQDELCSFYERADLDELHFCLQYLAPKCTPSHVSTMLQILKKRFTTYDLQTPTISSRLTSKLAGSSWAKRLTHWNIKASLTLNNSLDTSSETIRGLQSFLAYIDVETLESYGAYLHQQLQHRTITYDESRLILAFYRQRSDIQAIHTYALLRRIQDYYEDPVSPLLEYYQEFMLDMLPMFLSRQTQQRALLNLLNALYKPNPDSHSHASFVRLLMYLMPYLENTQRDTCKQRLHQEQIKIHSRDLYDQVQAICVSHEREVPEEVQPSFHMMKTLQHLIDREDAVAVIHLHAMSKNLSLFWLYQDMGDYSEQKLPSTLQMCIVEQICSFTLDVNTMILIDTIKPYLSQSALLSIKNTFLPHILQLSWVDLKEKYQLIPILKDVLEEDDITALLGWSEKKKILNTLLPLPRVIDMILEHSIHETSYQSVRSHLLHTIPYLDLEQLERLLSLPHLHHEHNIALARRAAHLEQLHLVREIFHRCDRSKQATFALHIYTHLPIYARAPLYEYTVEQSSSAYEDHDWATIADSVTVSLGNIRHLALSDAYAITECILLLPEDQQAWYLHTLTTTILEYSISVARKRALFHELRPLLPSSLFAYALMHLFCEEATPRTDVPGDQYVVYHLRATLRPLLSLSFDVVQYAWDTVLLPWMKRQDQLILYRYILPAILPWLYRVGRQHAINQIYHDCILTNDCWK